MTTKQTISTLLILIGITHNAIAIKPRSFMMDTNADRFAQSLPVDSSRFDKTVILETSDHRFEYMGKLKDVDPQGIKKIIATTGQKLSDTDISDWISLSMKMLEIGITDRNFAAKTLQLMKNPLNQELIRSQLRNEFEIPCVLCPSFGTYNGDAYDAIVFDTDDIHECEKLKNATEKLSEEEKTRILKQ